MYSKTIWSSTSLAVRQSSSAIALSRLSPLQMLWIIESVMAYGREDALKCSIFLDLLFFGSHEFSVQTILESYRCLKNEIHIEWISLLVFEWKEMMLSLMTSKNVWLPLDWYNSRALVMF